MTDFSSTHNRPCTSWPLEVFNFLTMHKISRVICCLFGFRSLKEDVARLNQDIAAQQEEERSVQQELRNLSKFLEKTEATASQLKRKKNQLDTKINELRDSMEPDNEGNEIFLQREAETLRERVEQENQVFEVTFTNVCGWLQVFPKRLLIMFWNCWNFNLFENDGIDLGSKKLKMQVIRPVRVAWWSSYSSLILQVSTQLNFDQKPNWKQWMLTQLYRGAVDVNTRNSIGSRRS